MHCRIIAYMGGYCLASLESLGALPATVNIDRVDDRYPTS